MFHKQQIKNIKYPLNDPFSTNTIHHISTRRNKQNKNHVIEQSSIDIDPWHINSCKKENLNTKFKNIYDQPTNRRLCLTSERKYTKNFSFQTLNHQTNKNPFHLIVAGDGIQTPTKIDMLECSFRFQEYQQQKAQQIKSKFANQIKKETQKYQNEDNILEKKKKNFIQRNIKNAFFIENQIQMSKINPKTDLEKTICQQAKQKLLLNNEKLERSSKQLQNFISMKEQNPKKIQIQKLQKYVYKIPIESKWNFSYVEKEVNPQKNQYKGNKFQKALLKSRGKSQQTKRRQYRKNNETFSKNDNHNQLSRKLSRLFKVKNRSTLVIQNDLVENNKRKNFRSQSKQSYRIHSLSPNKKHQQIQPSHLFVQFQKEIHPHLLKNQDQSPTKLKTRQHQRSFSANLIKRNTCHLYQPKFIQKNLKIKPHQRIKEYLLVKNIYLEGKQCQLGHFPNK